MTTNNPYNSHNPNSQDALNNISKSLVQFAENIQKVTVGLSESLQRLANSSEFRQFITYLDNLPKDTKESQLYVRVQELANPDLKYEDVEWLPESFGIYDVGEVKQHLEDSTYGKGTVESYIKSVILSHNMNRRNKLVLLLAHIELLFYKTLGLEKKVDSHLRNEAEIALKNHSDIKSEGIQAYTYVYMLGLVLVIFARTDKFAQLIDHRIPFRNNILHNGIVDYSDKDVAIAYEFLLKCIGMMLAIEEKKIDTSSMQL